MHDKLWQAVLGEIEVSVSRGSFVSWFKDSRILSYKEGILTIGVVNVFARVQIENRYQPIIMELLKKNGLEPTKIVCKGITNSQRAEKLEEPTAQRNLLQKAPSHTPTHTRPSVSHAYRQGVNERYTFDNFIVGSGNELAHAACQAVATDPGKKYNPLFLYGGVGIGKTHLIQAVGNEIMARNPEARVVYVSTEQFVQEFIDAVRYKKNTEFAGYYRNADVLILDDIQFIAGKDKTQEEFFHTFNTLHQAQKQIIISSDLPPTNIPTLDDRLSSRFAWGMSIDMQIPDYETRCAIVKTKAGAHQVTLPNDVVEFLANLIQTNIRELEGALNQLLAFCEMRNLAPDLQIATGLLGGSKSRPKHISAKQIIERTAKHFQISLDDILGPKRDKDIVVPRQVAMYILRSELHLSFPKIARELGRKDHTTALHSVEKIEKEMHLNSPLRESIQVIRERLYA